jgi:hypothetical protein
MPVASRDCPGTPEFIPWAGSVAVSGLAFTAAGAAAFFLAAGTGGRSIGVCAAFTGIIQLAAAAVGKVADRILSRSAGESDHLPPAGD